MTPEEKARRANKRADARDLRLDLIRSLRIELPEATRISLVTSLNALPMTRKSRGEIMVLFGAPHG